MYKCINNTNTTNNSNINKDNECPMAFQGEAYILSMLSHLFFTSRK